MQLIGKNRRSDTNPERSSAKSNPCRLTENLRDGHNILFLCGQDFIYLLL